MEEFAMDSINPKAGASEYSDAPVRIAEWYRPILIGFLLLALGCDIFPLSFALQHHDTEKRLVALMLILCIPFPWVCIAVGNHKLKQLIDVSDIKASTQQAILGTIAVSSLALLVAVYSVIVVTTGNMFSCWK
jgi:cytochrome bd-type quinol oxidase subunit 1